MILYKINTTPVGIKKLSGNLNLDFLLSAQKYFTEPVDVKKTSGYIHILGAGSLVLAEGAGGPPAQSWSCNVRAPCGPVGTSRFASSPIT